MTTSAGTARTVRVLALDLSTKTGWACDGPDSSTGPPLGGLWRLPSLLPATVDHSLYELYKLVRRAIRDHRIDLVLYEAPMPAGVMKSKRNPQTDQALAAQTFVAGMAGISMDVATRQCAPSTWRKHFLGHGQPPDRKAMAVRRCAQLGWGADLNHNVAEAKGIWCLGKALYQQGWFPSGGRSLFEERRS